LRYVDRPISDVPTQRRPTSTLFPYTTLFRSEQRFARRLEPAQREQRAHQAQPPRRLGAARRSRHARVPRERSREPRHPGIVVGEDRKSTRLNSSHSQISYAVFCLKTKHTRPT